MKNTDNDMNENNTNDEYTNEKYRQMIWMKAYNDNNTNEKYGQWYESKHTLIIIRMKNTDNDTNINEKYR